MKHGQSSKTKPAKTSKKVSNKAAGKKPVAAKAGSKGKAAGKKEGPAFSKKESPAFSKKESPARAVKQAPSRASGGEKIRGKAKKVELSNTARNAAARAEGVVFTTTEVGAAYRRAVQKFGAALKRLSD